MLIGPLTLGVFLGENNSGPNFFSDGSEFCGSPTFCSGNMGNWSYELGAADEQFWNNMVFFFCSLTDKIVATNVARPGRLLSGEN